MVFSSLLFVYAFLPLSLLAYFLCRSTRAQNAALLVFSLIFYAWGEPKYVLLLMFMALSSWMCALCAAAAPTRRSARAWVAVAITVDLLLIGFFKYAGLFCSVFGRTPDFIRSIALPIGISFYTFQLMTYVIDVYRGEAEPQLSYWNVLLYAALFHQCVAGPIVRYGSIADELFAEKRSSEELLPGIRRFTAGLAKKALLANPCGALADSLLLESSVAADPALFAANLSSLTDLTVLGSWLGAAAYMLQIYLDFSAYSDMAIGMGLMLGLHYPENFRHPYAARSVRDFWRRWHISLGAFFRDYVYIPLGGNRDGLWRTLLNTLIVWALTGLWHGASWNFVLWGLYYFVFLSLESLFLRKLFKNFRVLPHLYLILVVLVGWILFRFNDVRLGWALFGNLFALNGNALSDFLSVTVLENHLFLLLASILVCLPVGPWLRGKIEKRCARDAALSRSWEIVSNCVLPVLLLLLATCALVGDSYNPFIYFQF